MIEKRLEEIQNQYSMGNDHKVVRMVDKLLHVPEYENHYNLLMFKAQSQNNLHQDDLCIQTYEHIIQLYPEDVLAKFALGVLLASLGQFEEAEHHFQAALVLDPENLEVIQELIGIEIDFNNYEKVLELAEKKLTIDDRDPITWLTISGAHDFLEDYREAIKCAKKAVSLAQKDEITLQMAYGDLGYTYSKMKDFSNAEYYLRKALELDEEDPYSLNNLGFVLANQGMIKEGLEMIDKSIELDDMNSYAYKNRAKVYLMMGKKEWAKRELIKAKKLDYELDYGNEVNELLKGL